MDLFVASGELPWRLCWVTAALLLFAWAAAGLNWAWWRPRRLERALRAQGLRGTPYRFIAGDRKEKARLNVAACAKPVPISHDIVPRVAPFLRQAVEEFGKTSFTWFGPLPRVIITDPELVREVLSKKFGHFNRPNVNPLARLFTSGVLSYEGEKWAKHRRILNPAFHVEELKKMLPTFSACCSDLVGRWEDLGRKVDSFELDVWPELQNFTGDVISRTAFGSSYEEGRRIFQLLTEQGDLVMKAIQGMLQQLPSLQYLRYLIVHQSCSGLPTPRNRRIKAINREVQTLLSGIIKKREEAIKMGEASKDDLLGLLLESNKQQCQEQGKRNAGMTIEEVIGECKLFYFAGQETTSVLLTWTMVVLSMHPEWQVRVREEVLQVFRKSKPEIDGLNHLKNLTMILYEVLRLYPPVVVLQRRTCKTVKVGDIVYPKGLLITLPIIIIHHDPQLWGKDADEFKPERFSKGIAKASQDHNVFFPFSTGPRFCIGQNFVLLEAKMALSMILQRFSFELSPSYAHAPRPTTTLQPKYGAQLRLHKL